MSESTNPPSTKSKELKDIQEKMTAAAAMLQGVAKPVLDVITFLLPKIINYTMIAYVSFKKLPQNVMNFLIGFVFCFFGGLYPVLFAAVQAAEYGGRKTIMEAVSDLANEALTIIEESKKDDELDEDNDGKADTSQLSGQDYMKRKTLLVIRKMNPEKIDKAMTNIYRVWLAVAAVLTIEFARAISMALAISDFLKKPIDRFVAPTIQKAVPDDYDKWVPVICGWVTKSIGMSIAWYIQTVRSAFASALVGGLMMARATYLALQHRDIKLGGLIKDNHEDSALDEGLSYVFAALGFFFQFKIGFRMPAPFNILLFPFQFLETYMRWTITKASGQ
uniref:Uncharacterized protein n=1 Tax=Craspedostauros australis TaxID=1486917 RepID=A0A7R9WR56_9STRA|mmetsp:Transcript_16760/g.46320  ORF Transcript_16760/g.46320 Transcript_16760/m.46320 type:complete len:334 (+) Transcript_16760:91-1092(+)|eukprot:CAMPEP_0198133562 /NCGR_PEP_ID=MMETSP1442-20131203/59629_1 /TAXON_ID= /ORGANISM="Craspedostauros australis, Strain CCMP3328" /LENGTH=333 /DNA_ID=CAMNT_0043794685 /DNA_START=84 /DNA_END=1085 /DNA_ORIENTATION=+